MCRGRDPGGLAAGRPRGARHAAWPPARACACARDSGGVRPPSALPHRGRLSRSRSRKQVNASAPAPPEGVEANAAAASSRRGGPHPAAPPPPPQAPRRGRWGPRVTRGRERGRRRGQSRCAEWHLLPGPLPVAAASLPACGGSGQTRGASSVPPSGEAWGPPAAPARKPDSEAQSGEEDARFLDCPVITNYPFWEWPLCLKSHFPPSVVPVFELFVLCTLLKNQNSGPFCCMPVTRHRASGASSRPPGGGGGSAAPQSDASS